MLVFKRIAAHTWLWGEQYGAPWSWSSLKQPYLRCAGAKGKEALLHYPAQQHPRGWAEDLGDGASTLETPAVAAARIHNRPLSG